MATQITTDEELAVLLGTLGNTADAIAANLRAQGSKGLRGKARQCPIASWLTHEVSDATDVVVNAVAIDVRVAPKKWLTCATTTPVAGFVVNFDANLYPDLIDAAADR